jgi:hypothetical protein
LFLKVYWDPFESKFKPIQDRFLDHTLVVVRSAGAQSLAMQHEKQRREDLENKGSRELAVSLSHLSKKTND